MRVCPGAKSLRFLAQLMVTIVSLMAGPTPLFTKAQTQQPSSLPKTQQQASSRDLVLAPDDKVKQLPSNSKRWALIIGIDQYDDKRINRLEGAVNDAKTLEDALIKHADFAQQHIIRLSSDQPEDHQPTRGNIVQTLVRLKQLVPKDGLLLFAFSGHGTSVGENAYLLPSNAKMENDIDYLELDAIPILSVKKLINATGVRQRILLLDACRNNPSGRGGGGNALTEAYEQGLKFDRRNDQIDAFVTIYATQFGQKAYEDTKSNMGYFTKALVEGITGAAANQTTGEITFASLMKYLRNVVPERTLLNEGEKQEPWWTTDGYAEDLVIAKVAPTVKEVAVKADPKGMLIIHTNPAAAKLEIKPETGAALSGTSNEDGQYQVYLPPGKYQVTVHAEKYAPRTKEVAVRLGNVEPVTINLDPTTGSILLLGSFPKNVSISVNGTPTTYTSKPDNKIELPDVLAGSYTVRVSHPSIVTKEEKVVVKGGESTSHYVELERSMTHLTIKSEPAALVYIDDVFRGKLLNTGEVTIDVEPNSHRIKIEKEGYDTVEQVKAMVAGPTALEMKLARKPVKEAAPVTAQIRKMPLIIGTLSSRGPVAANVVVQSQEGGFKQEGVSDKGHYRVELNPGLYTVSVTAEHYLPYKREITITAGQPLDVLSVDLVPTSGDIVLLGAFQPDMEILLDGNPPVGVTRSENGIELKDVPVGPHKIQVKHRTIETWEREVKVMGSSPTSVPAAFEKRMAQLTIKSEPSAEIFIDNIKMGRVNPSGEVKIPGIEPGQHKIRAEKEGYDPVEDTRTFEAGKKEVTLKLISLAFGGAFSSDFTADLQPWIAPQTWRVSHEKLNVGAIVSGPGQGLIKDTVNDRPAIYKNFKMEFDVSFRNGKGAAWVVRYRDSGNYYLFQLIGPKGSPSKRFMSWICQDGQIKPLKGPEYVPVDLSRSNDSYHVVVEVQGAEIKHKIKATSDPKEEHQTLSVLQNAVFLQGAVGFSTKDNEEFLVRWIDIVPDK